MSKLSIYPSEVLGKVFRFVPTKEIPIISTSNNEFPDIFLTYAPFDNIIKCGRCGPNHNNLSSDKNIYHYPGAMTKYQARDIPYIIKSNTIPNYLILYYLAECGLLDLIKLYWNIWSVNQYDDKSTVNRKFGTLFSAIFLSGQKGYLDTLIWLWDQWYPKIKDDVEILKYLVGKQTQNGIQNKEISELLTILLHKLIISSKKYPKIVGWFLNLDNIEYNFEIIFMNMAFRTHLHPREDSVIGSSDLILNSMNKENILSLLNRAINRAINSKIPDIDMLKYLLISGGNYTTNQLITVSAMRKIIQKDCVEIMSLLLKDPEFDPSLYFNIFSWIARKNAEKILDLILSDGRGDPINSLFVFRNNTISLARPFRITLNLGHHHLVKRYYRDSRIKNCLCLNLILNHGMGYLLDY